MERIDFILEEVLKHPLVLTMMGQAVFFTSVWSYDIQNKKGLKWWSKNKPRMIATFIFSVTFLVLDDEAILLAEILLNKDYPDEFSWIFYLLLPIIAERSHSLYTWALKLKLPIGR